MYFNKHPEHPIAGFVLVIGIFITFFIFNMIQKSPIWWIIFSIWLLFDMIYPEILYLSYASKDRIYYLETQSHETLSDGIRVGICCINWMNLILSTILFIIFLATGEYVVFLPFPFCIFIAFIPFKYVCTHVTSLKIKIWCFFKYVVFYSLLLMEILWFFLTGIMAVLGEVC